MRSEAELVSRSIRGLKELLPGAVVFKHSDLRTAGIPDFSVSYFGLTTWVEAKFIKEGRVSDLKKAFAGVQLGTAVLLSRQARVFYLVAYSGGNHAALLLPDMVRESLSVKDDLPGLLCRTSSKGAYHEILEELAGRMSTGKPRFPEAF